MRDPAKGIAAGLIAGTVASLVMNRFEAFCAMLLTTRQEAHGAQAPQGKSAKEDAPEKVARLIAKKLFHRRLGKEEKRMAATAAHYAFGAAVGGLYGLIAEFAPPVTALLGIPWGVAIWAVADEGIMPALRLSKGATEQSFSVHAYALSSHLVYGLTSEITRKVLREAYLGGEVT